MPTAHDFEKQRQETAWVWQDLNARKSLPKRISLDIQFVPEGAVSFWDECEAALAAIGFEVSRYDDGSTLEASVGPIENTLERIWYFERSATECALNYGFKPDGWGFFS